MKKMIKLSLVAAVAVAGLTTTSNAKPLISAIKNVDISGMVRYRTQDMTSKNGNQKEENNSFETTKIVLGIKSKVNNKITASIKAISASTSYGKAKGKAATLNVAKLTYANSGTTVTGGLMELSTPWTDASDGARANGLLITQQYGAVTLAGAHFRSSNMGADAQEDSNQVAVALDSNNMNAIALIGRSSIVNYQAWYMNVGSKDTNTAKDSVSTLPVGATAVAVLAGINAGPVALDLSYASLEGKHDSLKKQTLTKAVATMKTPVGALVLGAAKGGDDGDLVTFDGDAKVGFKSGDNGIIAGGFGQYKLSAATAAFVIPAGMANVKLQYTTVSFDGEKENPAQTYKANELRVVTGYKMSKNFTASLDLAKKTTTTTTVATSTEFEEKQTLARVELKYTF